MLLVPWEGHHRTQQQGVTKALCNVNTGKWRQLQPSSRGGGIAMPLSSEEQRVVGLGLDKDSFQKPDS